MTKESRSRDRREFLKQAGLLGAGLLAGGEVVATGAAPAAAASGERQPPAIRVVSGQVPRKMLGRTGVEVSALALGGSHIGQAKDLDTAIRIVHEAIDNGLTFMDNAWEYNDGRSEEWMGRALQGRRDKVFLMTKVCSHGRDKKVALRMLEESLTRLGTDHLDLWQIHECVYYNDPDLHYMPGGAIEALEQAKKDGKVRFVGFTGHKDPEIHLQMLEKGFAFDTVQMPLNVLDASYHSFEQHVLPEVQKRGMAAIGMKSLGGSGELINKGVVTVQEALRYAMSLPVATTVSGIDTPEVLHQNLEIARNFTPMTTAEMHAMRIRCAPYAGDGHLELYKSTKKYDAAEGRKQHGYPTKEELPL